MREIKDWIGRHVKLSPDDLRLISYPSGKEMRAFEVTVSNLISNSRRSNLTAKGLVASLGHDQFQITPAGRKVLDQADAARELLLKIIGDVDLSED